MVDKRTHVVHCVGAWTKMSQKQCVIEPQAQGRGLGRKLLEPMLNEADAATASCYLETFSIRNVTFYTRLGFGVVGMPHEPTTGAHYAIMLRHPHPDSSNIAPDLASTI